MNDNPDAPVCYRHPRKETHVTCARCGRPICPDCMKQASVGWQCPDCVSQGNKSVRSARTALGGRGGHSGVVTKTLIGINVAVFVIGLIMSGANLAGYLFGGQSFLHQMGALWAPGLAFGNQYYRLVTSMFLHYGILHLAFNMYILWIIGRYLERELGPGRYLALYLASGLGGGVITYLFADIGAGADLNNYVATAGASGCIFGLFGAMVFINQKLGRDNSGVYVLLGLNLVLTFVVSNISWTGHLGGLITGGLLGYVLAHSPRDKRMPIQIGAFVAIAVIFAAATLFRTTQLHEMFLGSMV